MEKADQTNQAKLDDKIKELCGGSKGKENRFVSINLYFVSKTEANFSLFSVLLHWRLTRIGHLHYE